MLDQLTTVMIAINKMNRLGFYLLTASELVLNKILIKNIFLVRLLKLPLNKLLCYMIHMHIWSQWKYKVYNGITTEKVDFFIIIYI